MKVKDDVKFDPIYISPSFVGHVKDFLSMSFF